MGWTARSRRRRISVTRRAFRRQQGVAVYDLCVVFVEFEKLLYLFTGGDLHLVGHEFAQGLPTRLF